VRRRQRGKGVGREGGERGRVRRGRNTGYYFSEYHFLNVSNTIACFQIK
jgi:hypothetical protein